MPKKQNDDSWQSDSGDETLNPLPNDAVDETTDDGSDPKSKQAAPAPQQGNPPPTPPVSMATLAGLTGLNAPNAMPQDMVGNRPVTPGGQPPPPSRASTLYNAGPPAPPHPGILRRLAAAGLAGAAGYMNADAGRPGHIARPIDPSAGVKNILGVTGYQNKMAQWIQQVKL